MLERAASPIPAIVIGRLPLYLRALRRLQQEGSTFASSNELGARLAVSSAQIRKDLSHFGGFGKQGTGYHIEYLIEHLQAVLQVDREWQVAVVGVGNLGSAIVHYKGFQNHGFRIVQVFDSNPEIVGKRIGSFVVQPMSDMGESIRSAGIKIAMLAVPAAQAQAVAEQVIAAGVCALLNYAPIHLNVPSGVQVQHIDPVQHLQQMTYYLDD